MEEADPKKNEPQENANPEDIKKENKLKDIFNNSFTTEPINTTQKEEAGDFCVVDKNQIDDYEPTNEKKAEYQDIYRFKKELNLKKKYKKFHILYNDSKSINDDKLAYKLGKILIFTYGKNYPKITSYKTKKTFTTDAWWGCMVRCGQMILSRGIYRLLKGANLDTRNALYYTCALFRNYPITEENLHKYFHGMLKKYKTGMPPEKKIKEFYPPFSIKTLCEVGELFERTAGEWFSDVIITNAFKYISEYYDLFNESLKIKILTFQSCLEIQSILDACFIQKEFEKGNEQYIHSKGKYYYFDKKGIIFINVRIGLEKIPVEYYRGIKDLLSLKECIGIIGGKTRQAFYFMGYNDEDNSLFYLDPHIIKDSDKTITHENILVKHVNKEVHLLKMSKMSTAFTIGFCFRTYDEYLELYGFWQKAKQSDHPILGVIKQPIVVDVKDDINEDENPYADKDEDDF